MSEKRNFYAGMKGGVAEVRRESCEVYVTQGAQRVLCGMDKQLTIDRPKSKLGNRIYRFAANALNSMIRILIIIMKTLCPGQGLDTELLQTGG